MIKPEFWDDEKLSKVSRDSRLTFIGLWTYADDTGIVKGNLKWLQNKIYPYDDMKAETFKKWIDELIGLKVIMPFGSNGESYIHIKNFPKHQTINKPSANKNPYPEETLLKEYYGSTTVVVMYEDKLSEEKIKITRTHNEQGFPVGENNVYKKEALFEFVWNKYPNKDGKKSAFKYFMTSVKTEEDLENIVKAIGNYLHSKKVEEGYIKNGSTFFNNWQDWINYSGNGVHEIKDPNKIQLPDK